MFLGLIQQALTDTSGVTVHKNSELFMKIDPWGIGMTVIGYVVVFMALLLLYIIFFNLTKVLQINVKRLLRREGREVKKEEDISIHDKEDAVLTINKVSKTYSPWSSKIYGLRQFPR